MIRILAYLCILISNFTLANNSLFSEDSFVAVVRNTQSGIFYGDPVIRELVDESLFSGVYVLYLDPSTINTRSEKIEKYKRIAQKLNVIKPVSIYIPKEDTSIIDFLDKEIASKVSVLTFSIPDKYYRYADKISSLLNISKVKAKTIIILKDSSVYSQESSSLLNKYLKSLKKLPNTSIKTLKVKSFQDIRITLNSLSNEKDLVLINNLTILKDIELGRYKSSDDIKIEFIKYNNVHFDIGFHTASINESIIIRDSPEDIYSVFYDESLNDYYIRVEVFVNPNRLNYLKFNYLLTNYFYQIDGLID